MRVSRPSVKLSIIEELTSLSLLANSVVDILTGALELTESVLIYSSDIDGNGIKKLFPLLGVGVTTGIDAVGVIIAGADVIWLSGANVIVARADVFVAAVGVSILGVVVTVSILGVDCRDTELLRSSSTAVSIQWQAMCTDNNI